MRALSFFLVFLLISLLLPVAQESRGFPGDTLASGGTAESEDAPAAEEESGAIVDGGDAGDDEKSEEEKKAEEEKAKEEAIESLNKQRREVLLYGIDSEVQDVISTIRSQKDTAFNKELDSLLRENENPDINRAILDFFAEMEIDISEDRALEFLNNHLDDYEYSTNLLLSSVSYLGRIKSDKAGAVFYDLLYDKNNSLAGAALRGIGKLEDASRADEILTLLQDSQGDSELEDLSASAILVLGELGYSEAQSDLEAILDDEDAPITHRQYAAVSLGRFGKTEGFELLKSMFVNSGNSQLRSYILKGISYYDNDEVEDLLMTALRDSFWKIRSAAAEGLGERKSRRAVDILQYKVRKDPVRQVRYASLEALAELGSSEAEAFVLEQFEGGRVAFDIRLKALNLMMDHKIGGSLDSLETVLRPKWSKDKDNELGPFCKVLSTSEWDSLRPFYAEMLNHSDFVIRIYGVRGVKLNRIGSLKEALKALDTEEQPVNVRREVKAALEAF